MRHREQALEFVRRFAAGDVDGLEPLLAEDLQLAGPYLQINSRADYLTALRSEPPERCGVRVLSVTDDGDTVAVFYDYEKRDVTLTIAQLFRFSDGRISEIRLVFDTRESA
jgi:ketosteroid isomerase-like protein